MKVLVTGQVGLDKREYLDYVKEIGDKSGKNVQVITVGEKMIEAYQGKIDEKTILNLPRVLLDILRRYAWKEIIHDMNSFKPDDIIIINSHAVFRWHHGLFPAIDLDLVQELSPDVIVTLIDDIDDIKRRCNIRGTDFFELWELLAWREEEIWMAKFLTDSLRKISSSLNAIKYFLLPRKQGAELLYRIVTEQDTPKVYISFPITQLPEQQKGEAEEFKGKILQKFIAFDPYSLSERKIVNIANSISEEINEAFSDTRKLVDDLCNNMSTEKLLWKPCWDDLSALATTNVDIGGNQLNGREIVSILEAIDSQIITRDWAHVTEVRQSKKRKMVWYCILIHLRL